MPQNNSCKMTLSAISQVLSTHVMQIKLNWFEKSPSELANFYALLDFFGNIHENAQWCITSNQQQRKYLNNLWTLVQ